MSEEIKQGTGAPEDVESVSETSEVVPNTGENQIEAGEVSNEAAPAKKKIKKSTIVGLILLVIGIAVTVLSMVFATQIFGKETVLEDGTVITEGSVFDKDVTGNSFINTVYSSWIPAIIRSIRVVTIAAIVSLILRFIMRLGFAHTPRGITIAKLMESFIKWVVAIASVLIVLGAFGVNTAALVASAGIVTLVIGLGAQSLVADIVAGIFLVFEGSFEVGDIVIVNDWRGTVQEIGIRTTKIIDAGGNVNIINNSQITTLVNQTKADSLAKCYISIDYRESIPRVEKVINDNLAAIKARIPYEIKGDIVYKGINSLGASGVELFFVATCKEDYVYDIQRAMNREFKILFDENNISIPFPQIVLNQPERFEGK